MADILDFNLNANQLVELAIKKHDDGDVTGAALYARKAIKASKGNITAYLVLALIYADDWEYELSNRVLFMGMHECHAWDNEEVRRALTINFMHMEDFDTARYYDPHNDPELTAIIEEESGLDEDFYDGEPPRGELYLSYPRTDEYYRRVIDDAMEFAYDENFDKAIELLKLVPDEMPCKEDADKALLMIYTMSGKMEEMVKYGESLLDKYPDSTILRCALASAYITRVDDMAAREVLAPIWQKDKLGAEEALALIPIAGHLEMHGEIVRLVKIALDADIKPEKHLLYLLSQALYNIGERDEARRIMADIRDYFGEFSNAEYVLREYANEPSSVKYGEDIPSSQREEVYRAVAELMLMPKEELCEFYKSHTADFDNFNYYFQFVMHSGKFDLISDFIATAMLLDGEPFKTFLCSDNVTYKGLSVLFIALFEATCSAQRRSLEFDVVTRNKFKHVQIDIPINYYRALPKTMLLGLQMAVTDILFLDDNPNDALNELFTTLFTMLIVCGGNDEGQRKRHRERFRRIRNERAFAALLFGEVYYVSDDLAEWGEEVLERYGVSKRLVEKYKRILFEESDSADLGVEDDEPEDIADVINDEENGENE